jgi:hypothetical protein
MLSRMEQNTSITWPDRPFNDVRAYFYNKSGDLFVPIITDGKLHQSVINPSGALLSESQLVRFTEAIFTPHSRTPVAACYKPRHAFVYRDSTQQVVATAGVCFECLTYSTSPRISNLLPDWVALAELVEELGLPLGRDMNASDMRNMFEKLSKMT